jgi:hypothetical protein
LWVRPGAYPRAELLNDVLLGQALVLLANTQLIDTQLTDTQLTDTQLTDTQLTDTQMTDNKSLAYYILEGGKIKFLHPYSLQNLLCPLALLAGGSIIRLNIHPDANVIMFFTSVIYELLQ